jgi:hypothetical protein
LMSSTSNVSYLSRASARRFSSFLWSLRICMARAYDSWSQKTREKNREKHWVGTMQFGQRM